jgi:hypothetical protein
VMIAGMLVTIRESPVLTLPFSILFLMCASSYWDWGADADAMEKSPVFDGSDTSLSGNGASIPNQLDIKVPLGNYTPTVLPPGTGGGCVTSGPFASYTVNMGPSFPISSRG